MCASSNDFIARVDEVVRGFPGSFQDFKALSVAELAVGSSKRVDSADRGSLPQEGQLVADAEPHIFAMLCAVILMTQEFHRGSSHDSVKSRRMDH